MPDNLPEALETTRLNMQRFIDTVLVPLDGQLETTTKIPLEIQEQVRQASRAAGFFYRTQPLEFGGNPAGTLELTLLREMLAATNTRLASYVFGPGPGLLHAAEGELRSRYLEPLMRGEKTSAFGFTEPDTAPRPTWAVLEGDSLVVSGQKSFVFW
jgi:acyl-CoA dehydrogenase